MAKVNLRSEESLQSALLRFGDAAFRICYMHTKNPKAARELLEDVFLQYLQHTKDFKDEEAERFWLLRTAHRACMDYYAAKLRKNPSDAQIKQAGRSLDFIISDELCKIMKLPYTSLTVLALCCGEEDSIAYAAKIAGQSAKSAEKRIKKALKKTELSEQDLREWIQTILMPDDMRSRIQYNIANTIKDKHYGINSRAAIFKRSMDRAVPYIALGVVCFCVLTVMVVRGGWFGNEYVRTPEYISTGDDTSIVINDPNDDGRGHASAGSETNSGDILTLPLSYLIPDGEGLAQYNCTIEADASILIAKMAEKGVFSSDVTLEDAVFVRNGEVITDLKSGDLPEVRLYFSAALQTHLNNDDHAEITLEAISRTVGGFYKTADINISKLEIYAGDQPITVNGAAVNCTDLLHGELPITAVSEE